MAEDRPDLKNQYALEQLSRKAEKDPKNKKTYFEAMAHPEHLPAQPGYQPIEPLDPEKNGETQKETYKSGWFDKAKNAVAGIFKKGSPPASTSQANNQTPTPIRQTPSAQPPAKAA